MSIITLKKTDNPNYSRDILKRDRTQARLEKKIISICQLYKDGMSLRKIAAIHKTSHETVRQILINHKILTKYQFYQKATGDKRVDKQGYVHIFLGVGEPGANKSGWVLEHRLVMQKHIGRPLMFWEIIHHVDRDKENNDIENLRITTSAEHSTCLRCPYYEFFFQKTGHKLITPDDLTG